MTMDNHSATASPGNEFIPRDGQTDTLVVVVVPCLNEEATIAGVVEGVPRSIAGADRVEVLVIDDGSSDDTAARAREAGAEVLVHGSNMGLGWTFSHAVRAVLERGASVMVNIDGDGQFDAGDIPTLVAPVLAGQADMVTASRFADRALIPEMPAVKKFGNFAVARIVQLLTGRRFHDVSCGFRALSSEALLRMNLFGTFTYTQESFLDLVFKDMEIMEIPVKVRGVREFGTSRIASSIPRYAWRSLKIMLGAFISYRPFSFFSILAAAFMAIALALLGFLGFHYLQTGGFSPHIWAGFVGGSFAFLAISTFTTGFVGELLLRIRRNQERVLYLLRRLVPGG
jgi:glycosyltransferase involved in cell wall biosynthesis